MSVLQTLTEGVQHRDMQAEGAALLNKWEATGLLEGLNDGQAKQGMAVLLENQAKELLREASSMAAGDVEGFAAVAFPIVRRVFGGLIANDLVSVQPMSLPSGLIFFLDFTHSNSEAGQGADSSLYGGGVVGREIVDGVQEIEQSGFYGLGGGYGSAKTTLTLGNAGISMARQADPEQQSSLDFDADLKGEEVIVATIDSTQDGLDAAAHALLDPRNRGAYAFRPAGVTIGDLTNEAVLIDDRTGDTLIVGNSAGNVLGAAAGLQAGASVVIRLRPVRRQTRLSTQTGSEGLKVVNHVERFVLKLVSVHASAAAAAVAATPAAARAIREAQDAVEVPLTSAMTGVLATALAAEDHTLEAPVRDDINASTNALGALQAGAMPLEEPSRDPLGNTTVKASGGVTGSDAGQAIAEIDIKVDSVAVTAQTKKLKAKWSPELGQDLNAITTSTQRLSLLVFFQSRLLLRSIVSFLASLFPAQPLVLLLEPRSRSFR